MSGVILATLIFSTSFVAHLTFSHLVRVSKRERTLTRFMLTASAAYVIGYPTVIEKVRAVFGPPVVSPGADFLSGLAGLGFLVLGYVEFWSLVERSFSLRILIDTSASPSGLTREDIGQAYAGGRGLGWMIEKRVEDLVGTGMLVRFGGTYRLGAKSRAVARAFQVLERLIGIA